MLIAAYAALRLLKKVTSVPSCWIANVYFSMASRCFPAWNSLFPSFLYACAVDMFLRESERLKSVQKINGLGNLGIQRVMYESRDGGPRRSAPHDGFEPPAWWRPWSSQSTLMAQSRATVSMYGDAPFMTWLDDRGREAETVTFAGLWDKAGAVAERMKLEWGVEAGDRVLLCYLPGMAFMVAYWACLRVRAVAVPAYPPDPNKLEIGLKKLDVVRKSCDAKLCLTERALDQMRMALSLTHSWPKGLEWHRTDVSLTCTHDVDADVDPGAVAFLQYTSGSTGDPKGVMLTYDNVWHNVNAVYLPTQLHVLELRDVTHSPENRVVGSSWLPQFHDTGLVLCIVAPLVAGYRMINFSPLTFLKSPLLWMQALDKYAVHWSAAPDFAYELCVRRLADRRHPFNVDLSTVQVMACGAGERCRPPQLARFIEAFEQFGLRTDVFAPTYGLAEHVVGTCTCLQGVKLSSFRPDLACCGEEFLTDLRIVDPSRRIQMPPHERGEIWLSSRSVAKGYWGKPDLSRETFHARLADGSPYEFLRTGDEGYVELGPKGPMLFICGRLKDLIIIGGKNYFPEDVEVAAQEADRDHIRPGCVAAFAAKDGGTATGDETITCVFELRAKALAKFDDDRKLAGLADGVKRQVGVAVGLLPGRILIIEERTIPKTTSGKVQRRQTRALVDAHGLKVLYDTDGVHPTVRGANRSKSLFPDTSSWLSQSIEGAFNYFSWPKTTTTVDVPAPDQTNGKIAHYDKDAKSEGAQQPPDDPELARTTTILLTAISEVISGPCSETQAFHELGLSSRQTVELLRRVERDVDVELPPTLVFSCPTVATLAAEICKLRRGDLDDDSDDAVPIANGPTFRHTSARVARLEVLTVAARLPGDCDDVAGSLRSLVAAGTQTASTVPISRWDVDVVDMGSADSAARARASYGAFCRGAAGFEPAVYGMRPVEAAALDPQQRVFLDRAFEALTAAGYRKEPAREHSCSRSLFMRASIPNTKTRALGGANVAVCLGMMNMDNSFAMTPKDVGPHDLTGNGYSSAGSRLSFLFDMRGPCVVVDTACSAALVAGHAAARFVTSGEADVGLFGGTSLMLAPSFVHVGAAVAAMTSVTGRCHTFDAVADGYCRGEGCAVVVLGPAAADHPDEPRAAAVSAGGFAVKHNGQSATFTALNAASQTRLLEATPGARAERAVEAHGTGTKLGDPIEVAGLTAFKTTITSSKQRRRCIAGVKANLGHTEPTAGAAGYLAAMLVAAANEPQPNACLRRANPVARFDKLAPSLESAPIASAKSGAPLAIGVSSFGYSGIIAHAVVEAPPTSERAWDDSTAPTLTGCLADEERHVVVRRRRAPGELDEARALESNSWRRPSLAHPASSAHPWLLPPRTSDAEAEIIMFEVKPQASRGSQSVAAATSRSVELALAVALAVGAKGLVDVNLTPEVDAGSALARCVVDGDEIRVETSAGVVVLAAQMLATSQSRLPLGRCLIFGRPDRVAESHALLSAEVGLAWRLGKLETRGLVVRTPGAFPSLCGASVEASRQLASLFISDDAAWASISEIHLPSEDLTSRRAWARVARRQNTGLASTELVVDCEVKAANVVVAIRGATLRRRPMAAVADDDAPVYEIAWTPCAPLRSKSRRALVLVPQERRRFSAAQSAAGCALSDCNVTRDAHVVVIASQDECTADRLGRLAPNFRQPTLPNRLRSSGWGDVHVVSPSLNQAYSDQLVEPCLVAARASVYRPRQLSGASERHRGCIVVEANDSYLWPVAVRAIGADIVVLRTNRVNEKAAEVLASMQKRPVIVFGTSALPQQLVNSAHEIRIVLGDDRQRPLVTRDDSSSRIVSIVHASSSPMRACVSSRHRLDGRSSFAQLGPATRFVAGMVNAALRNDAMAAWAAQVFVPFIDLRSSLVSSLHTTKSAPAAVKPASRRSRKRKTVNVRTAVHEVVERIVGPEALCNPFSDVGIDSLQGTEIARELSNRLGKEVSPMLLLDCSGVDDLIHAIGGADADGGEDIAEEQLAPAMDTVDTATTAASESTSALPATVKCAESTPDQELLFWMSSHQKHFTWLPVTAVGDLAGDLDVDALRRAVDAVVDRHEALRCRLVRVPLGYNDQRTLVVVDDCEERRPRLEIRDAPDSEAARREVQAYHDAYDNDAFEQRPLFRALLVRYPGAGNGHGPATNGVLYVSTNHAVSDGWSQQLLYNDLVAAYNDGPRAVAPARRYCEFLAVHNDEVGRLASDPRVEAQRREYSAAARLPSQWPTVCDDIATTLFETGALLHSDEIAIVSAEHVEAIETALRVSATDFGRATLPSACTAAYVAALEEAELGRAALLQYSHTGRIGKPELAETYGQIATEMNVIVPSGFSGDLVGPFVARVHTAVVHGLSLAAVPYALAYRDMAGRGRRLPLPPQFNWYDRYTAVPEWRGLTATEVAVDQTRMRTRTFNIGAIYLMGLVQSNGSLLLKFFFNEHVYSRATIRRALVHMQDFLGALATDGPVRCVIEPSPH